MAKAFNIVELEKGLIPPQALDMEEAVIGAVMCDAKSIDEVITVIKSSDVFYKDAHRFIYDAVQDLYNNNRPIDLLTVSEQLKRNEKLDYVGGDYYLISLVQKVGSSAHIEFHARIIVQNWMKREFIKTSSEVIGLCYDQSTDVFDVENYLESKLDLIRELISSGSNQLTMSQAVHHVVERVERLSYMEEGEITGIPTGFDKLDRLTGGWQDSDLIIIAARPGMGKSAFCSATILASVLKNKAVGVISLEMSTVQLVTRLMANNSNFHLNQLFRHGFNKDKINEYFPKLNALKDSMKGYPVYFNDTPALDIRDVKSAARLWKRKHGIKLLIVDYLQLVKDATKSNNREQEVSSITGQLKAIAKELNIPVIALSQLSRKVEDRGGLKKPQLADLRESGAIEQDADVIGFIWRPEYYKFEVPQELYDIGANTELNVAKHRNGSLERVGLWFDENKTKFQEQDPRFNSTPY